MGILDEGVLFKPGGDVRKLKVNTDTDSLYFLVFNLGEYPHVEDFSQTQCRV